MSIVQHMVYEFLELDVWFMTGVFLFGAWVLCMFAIAVIGFGLTGE